MAALSTAVDLNRVSAIVGYEIKKILKGVEAGNLPQRIAILAEANTANQSGLPTKIDFTSAKEVGEIMGYGSPAHIIARILRPISGDLLGGIPTVVYPVVEAGGATSEVKTVTITGTATKTTTHKIKINGREQLDGKNYSFVVEAGDAAAEITPKILDVVNNVLGAPAIVTNATDVATFTAKWKGLTSAELDIEIDVNGDAAGLTYAVAQGAAGAGVPSIATALTNLEEEWNTILLNGIGSDSTILDALEADNGDPNTRTGRYEPTVFKPYGALFGDNSLTTLSGVTSLLDSRKAEVTNIHCPAPNSKGFSFEAPANYSFIIAKLLQDSPHSDPIGLRLPDMPTAEDIGEYSDSSKRDQIVKVGGSTVKINSSQYEIVDFVTTYHPDDESPTATFFRWATDVMGVDFNIKYGYAFLEEINVVGKTILTDDSPSVEANTISPRRWKAVLNGYADSLEARALIVDAAAMKESIQVQLGGPNRLETSFEAKRRGIARVLSTTSGVLFNFG